MMVASPRAILPVDLAVSDGGNATVEGGRDVVTVTSRLPDDFQPEKTAAAHHEKIH